MIGGRLIHRESASGTLQYWFVKHFLVLTVLLFIAGQPSISTAQSKSTPQVTEWIYDMSGTAVINSWTQKIAQYGCSFTATPQPWSGTPTTRIYVNGGIGYISRGEFQKFDIQSPTENPCATIFYNISTCGGTCGGYTHNSRVRRLYCSFGYLADTRVGSGWNAWAWTCINPDPPKKVVVLDPGHGLTCPSIGQAAGAIGVTDFPVNDPPPGTLREDDLTVAIALAAEQMMSASYKVVLTKRDVNSCPSFKKRGEIARNEKAKAFVSIHINKPNTILGVEVPFANGTSVLYNSQSEGAKGLADRMASAVASSLGVNNRGSSDRDDLAVLKPHVTPTTAVLVEAARLSGSDEKILHARGAADKAANGIKMALDEFLGR